MNVQWTFHSICCKRSISVLGNILWLFKCLKFRPTKNISNWVLWTFTQDVKNWYSYLNIRECKFFNTRKESPCIYSLSVLLGKRKNPSQRNDLLCSSLSTFTFPFAWNQIIEPSFHYRHGQAFLKTPWTEELQKANASTNSSVFLWGVYTRKRSDSLEKVLETSPNVWDMNVCGGYFSVI